jgi:hypothetical protein
LEPKDTILDDWLENTKEIIWVVDSQDGELKENSLFSLTTLDGRRQITERYAVSSRAFFLTYRLTFFLLSYCLVCFLSLLACLLVCLLVVSVVLC